MSEVEWAETRRVVMNGGQGWGSAASAVKAREHVGASAARDMAHRPYPDEPILDDILNVQLDQAERRHDPDGGAEQERQQLRVGLLPHSDQAAGQGLTLVL